MYIWNYTVHVLYRPLSKQEIDKSIYTVTVHWSDIQATNKITEHSYSFLGQGSPQSGKYNTGGLHWYDY